MKRRELLFGVAAVALVAPFAPVLLRDSLYGKPIPIIYGFHYAIGDRVLFVNQTNPADNGVYVVSANSW